MKQQPAGPKSGWSLQRQPAQTQHGFVEVSASRVLRDTEGTFRFKPTHYRHGATPDKWAAISLYSLTPARYPRGLRERSAKPPFVGSNPTRASIIVPMFMRSFEGGR